MPFPLHSSSFLWIRFSRRSLGLSSSAYVGITRALSLISMKKHNIIVDLCKGPLFAKLSMPFTSVVTDGTPCIDHQERIMPRRVQPIKRPEIRLDATLSVPLYKQLYERLRGAILVGQLERGARLPSTRTLASELGISRSTTVLAYTQLLLEGYLESRVGQGTVVVRDLP